MQFCARLPPRPVEVLGLLGLTDLLEAGAVVERTRLELHEECGSDV